MTQPPIWTEAHVQQLLQTPDSLLADDSWRTAIRAMGGLDAVYRRLQELPLKEKQQAILTVLTTYPGAAVDTYCDLLHVHPATFHRHQRLLFRSLATLLTSTQPLAAPAVAPYPATRRALHQLPAPIADFLGRDAEAAALIAAIRGGANLAAIQGMGGLGKTELAFHVARSLIADFPDAQILIPCRGMRETPLSPVHALQTVLRLFRDDDLPGDIDALVPLYHACLHDKRVLIIADDARDATQVRPLMPPAGNALLITSRQRFTLPGMTAIVLDGLAPAAAQALLRKICGRISADDAHAISVATGDLPLAIRTSGSILANTPAMPISRYLQRLTDTRQRLAALRDPEDPALNVEVSLDLSYASLDPQDQQVLRQLAVLAAGFGTALAVAVAECPAGDEPAEERLYRLLRRNLLLYNTLDERWRMHDLVRALALKKAAAPEVDAAQWRYARAVVSTVQGVQERYLRGGDDALASLAEFDRERPHLDAAWQWALAHAATPDGDRLLVAVVQATQKFARLRYQNTTEREPLLHAARAAAQRLGDATAEANIVWKLGVLKSDQDDFAASMSILESAIAMFRAIGDDDTMLLVQVNLASTYTEMGDPARRDQTIALYHTLVRHLQPRSDRQREFGICINNLAIEYLHRGDLSTAVTYFEQARALGEQVGDYHSICNAIYNLGLVSTRLNQPAQAVQYHQQLLSLAQRLGDLQYQGNALHGMGEAYARSGDIAQAFQAFEAAIDIFVAMKCRLHEATSRSEYGLLLLGQGDRERAIPMLRASFGYFREVDYTPFAHLIDLLPRLEAGEPWSDEMLNPTNTA